MFRNKFLYTAHLLVWVGLYLMGQQLQAQGTSCAGADPFCSGSGSTFPAGVNAPAAPAGNNYGCLNTQPNPAWYYLQIANPGNIDITLTNSANRDIDFALWGPFPNLAAATGTCGAMPAPTDCSYSTAATEVVNIANGQAGQVYILLITNFSNSTTNISANQTGGVGSTNCDILLPCAPSNFQNITAGNPYNCSNSTVSLQALPRSASPGNLGITPGFQFTINTDANSSTQNTLQLFDAPGGTGNVVAYWGPTNTGGNYQGIVPNSAAFSGMIEFLDSTISYSMVWCDAGNNGSFVTNISHSGSNNIIRNTPLSGASGCTTVNLGQPDGYPRFFGPGVTNLNNGRGIFDPMLAGAGIHTISYEWRSVSGCKDTSTQTVVVCCNIPPASIITMTQGSNPLCAGQTAVLSTNVPSISSAISTYSNNAVRTINVQSTLSSNITVSGMCPYRISPNTIQSVCVNIDQSLARDLNLTLIAPDGTRMDLSSGNGGLTSNRFRNTCFSPTASTNITSFSGNSFPAIPDNSSFLPEQNFTTLNTKPTNGVWTLEVVHNRAAAGGGTNGTFRGWTLNFGSGATNNTYVWSGSNMSCTTCASPSVTPSSTTTYRVTATTPCGCEFTDSYEVTVTSPLAAPTGLSCATVTTNSIAFAWNSVTDASGFEISTDNGTTWSAYNGSTLTQPTHTITGLGLNQSVALLVRGIGVGCPSPASAVTCTTQNCPISATVSSQTNVGCFNGTDGTANISVTGAVGTLSYQITAPSTGTPQASNSFTGLAANVYSISVSDATLLCGVSVPLTISQPSALGISATVVSAHNGFSISCAGGGDGIATVLGSGGSGSYGYMWTNGRTAATQTGLSAGVHCVTITDANACTISQCVTLTEPTAVSVSANPTAVTCFGGNNGSASAVGTGGVGGYVFLWNDANNQTTGTATGLTAGTYTVTATDLNGCVANISTTITQPGASIQTNASSTPALCAGAGSGTATVSITGGTSPFAVLWSSNASGQTTNTATGLTAGNYSVTATDNLGCSASSTITVAAANGLSLIMSNTNATCAGYSNGTATASATGGAGGYLYAWANGQTTATATGLAAGSICVTVTDANGCPINDCATISQPQGMGNLQYAVQGVSCFGSADGRATVSFTGGVFPFSYVWDNNTNGATGTGFSPGAHSVTITDANNCTVTGSTNIPQPAQLQVSATADSVLCRFGTTGRTLATATGGTFPYAYLWSNGQNTALNDNLTANTYTVTVTDLNNCTATATTIVGQPASAVLANMTSVSQASCNGLANGSATVNGTGGTPNYTYLWSNGQTMATASGLSAGAYTVTLTDQRGCSATANTNISQPTALVATASVFSNYNGADVSCTNSNDGIARVIVSGGAGGYGYRWSSIPAQLTPVASGLLPGNYTVTVTDLSGCSVTRTVTLRNPVQLAATFSQVNVFCKGQNTGQIVVNATAGTGTLGINGYEYAIFGANQQGNVYSAVNQWFGLVAGTYTVIVRDGNNCQIPVSIQITEPSALSISTQSTAVLCNGTGTGTSATTITGGTSPYTYSWSDGQTSRIATGLVTGGYSVTATDANGCDIAAQVVITEPAALAISVSVNGVSCNGGNDGLAIAQPTGGVAPYRYRWSNGQTAQTGTNFIAGVHAITLTDANNCVLVSSFTVTEPLGLVSSITVQNLSCAASANGTATALAQGGTAPYTYAWINGQTTQTATGLNASVQRVVITDALGCQTQAQTTLTQPSVLSAQITAQTATLCANSADGTATVSPNGGTSGYTYLWSNGQTTAQATGLAANQSYTVTVTDANGCNTSISTTIPNPSALAITNTTHTDVLCRGGATGRATVFVSGGTLPYTYAWSNGQNSPVATGLAANLYSVTISDANGCATTTQVSIAQPTQALSMFVNTNPTLCAGGSTGQAVAVPGGGTPLAGNTYRYLWSNGQTTRGISGLLSGAYTVTVTDANGCTITNGGQVTDGGSSQVQAQVLQNPTCLGGNEGRATASGSSSNGGNVSYLWSTGQTIQTITGLTAGVYTVVVTDTTNCQATASVTVTDGISISASAVVNNVSCFGLADGDLQVTSSPAGVIYEWDNQFVATNGNLTDLAAGEYTVTISIAQGCRQDFTFTVTEPQSITLATAQTRAITCYDGNNGAANVSVTGGSPAYSYLWSNGVQTDAIDSISAGGYSVVVTDANGCTATSTIAIVEPAELIVTVTSTGLLCSNSQNGQIAVGATGGTLNLGLYEYGISTDSTPVSLWQTGNLFPNLSAGDFYVQVRDINGCSDTAQINVKAALPFFITSATADTTIQFLDSLQLAVGLNDTTNNTVSSNWILLGANGDTLASNKYLLWIAPQDAGQYHFKATNQNGCIVDTTINIGVLKNRFANAPTGFTPNNDGTNDKFFIQAANESKIEKILTFRVYDRWGELVHEALDVMPNDDSKGWDGTFKGKEMNAGVFAWYAEVKYKDGFIQTIKGDVTLLK